MGQKEEYLNFRVVKGKFWLRVDTKEALKGVPKEKWDNSSISQEVPQEGATYLSWAARDNMGQIQFLPWTL